MFRNKKTVKSLPSLEVEPSGELLPAESVQTPSQRILGFLSANSPAKAVGGLLSPIRNQKSLSRKGSKEVEDKEDSKQFPKGTISSFKKQQEDLEPIAVSAQVGDYDEKQEQIPLALPPLVKVPSLTAPESMLMHKGNKLFWRINRTIDFRIYIASSCGAIVIRSFDSELDCEFEPIILEWDKVVSQVKHGEAAATSHQAELAKLDRKVDHEEDEIFKRIRREKSILERRKKTTKMTDEVFKHAQESLEKEKEEELLKELDAFRGRVVQFILNRFEAVKDPQTNEISTCIMKRPSDAPTSLEFDAEAVPVGVAHVGEDEPWQKKECTKAFRRKSFDVTAGLEETNQASRRASDTQKAIQVALDIVKGLSLRSKKQSKFKTMVRRTMFKAKLEKTNSVLKRMGSFSSRSKKVAPVIQEEDE